MSKLKSFLPLSIVILALLMIFTSAAQAAPKKPNPGHDNPGTTEISKSDGFFSAGISYKGCFDKDKYCSGAWADYVGAAWDEGSAEALGYASAYADVACKASSKAHAKFATLMIGGGSLDLYRHGENGAMHHIELSAGYGSASAFMVDANAFADTYAEGDTFVLGGVAGLDGACESDWDGPFKIVYCEWLAGAGDGIAESAAQAESFGSGWAEAGFSGTAELDVFNGVWAANIEKYVAVVAGGASNYAWAGTGSQAGAMADAYIDASLETYIEICESELALFFGIFPVGFELYCSQGYAAAYASAMAEADVFAAAEANALLRTNSSVKFKAVYINRDGLEDVMYFGAEGSAGTPAQTSVSCDAFAE